MTRLPRYIAGLAVFFALLVAYALWHHAPPAPTPGAKLVVAFIGITNNPSLALPGVALCLRGATGLCAVFSVTNIAGTNVAKDPWIWFESSSVEQKTQTGWQLIMPDSNAWSGIEGTLWPPGYSRLYAVGWPPGIPTNASWRLRVRYGREPSALATEVNQKLRQKLFRSGKEEQTVSSSEVSQ